MDATVNSHPRVTYSERVLQIYSSPLPGTRDGYVDRDDVDTYQHSGTECFVPPITVTPLNKRTQSRVPFVRTATTKWLTDRGMHMKPYVNIFRLEDGSCGGGYIEVLFFAQLKPGIMDFVIPESEAGL